MPSVPVTGAGVVIVATVSGVNRVAGSMPPGGTSGGGVAASTTGVGVVTGVGVAAGADVQAASTNPAATHGTAATHRTRRSVMAIPLDEQSGSPGPFPRYRLSMIEESDSDKTPGELSEDRSSPRPSQLTDS